MVGNHFSNGLEAGVVLAASRKKAKISRNQRPTKYNSKFRDGSNSRRSNSVSTNRAKRANSTKRRSASKFHLKKMTKSGSNLRGNRYIKNILPIVAQENGRGAIANNFEK